MTFKDFSIFSYLGGHLVYRSGKIITFLVGSHLGNIPMKLDHIGQRVQEELAFKANYSRFSIFSSGGHFVHRSKTVLAVLVEGHLRNIPKKFKLNRLRGIGGVDI